MKNANKSLIQKSVFNPWTNFNRFDTVEMALQSTICSKNLVQTCEGNAIRNEDEKSNHSLKALIILIFYHKKAKKH